MGDYLLSSRGRLAVPLPDSNLKFTSCHQTANPLDPDGVENGTPIKRALSAKSRLRWLLPSASGVRAIACTPLSLPGQDPPRL